MKVLIQSERKSKLLEIFHIFTIHGVSEKRHPFLSFITQSNIDQFT